MIAGWLQYVDYGLRLSRAVVFALLVLCLRSSDTPLILNGNFYVLHPGWAWYLLHLTTLRGRRCTNAFAPSAMKGSGKISSSREH
jgi:hypothetical protein